MPNKPTFDTIGDEPLEARIVAWVLGDASAFEATELERLCEERPELLVFRRRMHALHGLLTEAAVQEADHSAKLPPEKRKLLDDIFGEEAPAVLLETQRQARIRSGWRHRMLAIAACLLVMVVLGGLAAPRLLRMSKNAAVAMQERTSSKPSASVASEVVISELKKAIREQEDAVEERRKMLASIVRSKGIIYHGQGADDDNGARSDSRSDAIKRGLDAQDYTDAKREFESEQQLLQQLKLKLIDEQIASKLPDDGKPKAPHMMAFRGMDDSKSYSVPLKTDYPPELIEGTPKVILPGLKSIPYEAPVAGGQASQKADQPGNAPAASRPQPALAANSKERAATRASMAIPDDDGDHFGEMAPLSSLGGTGGADAGRGFGGKGAGKGAVSAPGAVAGLAAAPLNTGNLALSDRNTGVPPVREDSASRLSAHETTGWTPVVHDRQDASPPAKLRVVGGPPLPLLSLSPRRSAGRRVAVG